MEHAIDTAQAPEPTSPIVLDHGDHITETTAAVSDDRSELDRHKESRGFVKPQTNTPPPTPEPTTEGEPEPITAKPEEKKNERWNDPDTGDTYDMRHKVARRIKTVLEDRGKERARADAAEARVQELTKILIERGQTPARAEAQAQATVDANAEPDPTNTEKYPEGQYDRAYVRDLALWAADQKTAALNTTLRTERGMEARQAAEAQVVTRWQQTLPDAQKKYPDFADQLAKFPNTPEHEPIKEMLFGSPVGNDVVYAVGAQPRLHEAYMKAPNERSRVRLLAHVEAQILAQRDKTTKTPPATTAAPLPIDPVHTGDGPAGPTDWSKNDPDQYQRWKANRNQRR